jgi:hypothetical protein
MLGRDLIDIHAHFFTDDIALPYGPLVCETSTAFLFRTGASKVRWT